MLAELNTLLPGYSQQEISYVQQTDTPSAILENPEFLPHKVLSFLLHFPTSDNYLSARLASAFLGGLTVLLFFYAANKWYSRRTAFLATVLLATSAWFLHTSRVALPDILYPVSLLLLGLTAYKLQITKRPLLLWSFAILLVGALWYIPGILWLLILGVVLQRKKLLANLRTIPPKKLPILGIPSFVVLGILALVLIKNLASLKVILGISGGLPLPLDYLLHVLYTPVSIIAFAPLNPSFRLGHVPFLDIVTSVLFGAGLYYYLYYRKSLRTKLLLIALAVGVLFSALHTYESQALLLVPAFIIIAAGISVITNQWLTVFPRNPVARTVGILLVSVVVGASCIYSLRSYFVAWPNTSATKDAYRQIL